MAIYSGFSHYQMVIFQFAYVSLPEGNYMGMGQN